MSRYIKQKFNALEDFRIKLSEAQLEHLKFLPTEPSIARFMRTLIKQALA